MWANKFGDLYQVFKLPDEHVNPVVSSAVGGIWQKILMLLKMLKFLIPFLALSIPNTLAHA